MTNTSSTSVNPAQKEALAISLNIKPSELESLGADNGTYKFKANGKTFSVHESTLSNLEFYRANAI
ncbi:hypothetical protein [Photobacterium kishitanii]|uniref:Uncharacterized protein n=1 Tax=Photobacterium kishitanii TaxID=318456 RepID=A0A2T3KKR8_9GAMM|nr:hypothetical protein [Photobacterium kishitanii]PSV00314.1 hypothetical protein C9J27_04100 [Photobacterium kishitanii]